MNRDSITEDVRNIAAAVSQNPFISTEIKKLENQVLYELSFVPSKDKDLDKACIQVYLDRYIPLFAQHVVWVAIMFGKVSVGTGKAKVYNSVRNLVEIRVPVVDPMYETGYDEDEIEFIEKEETKTYTFEPSWVFGKISSIGSRMALLHSLFSHMVSSSMAACQAGSIPTAIVTTEKLDPNVMTNFSERATLLENRQNIRDKILTRDRRAYDMLHDQLSHLQDEIYEANKAKTAMQMTPYTETPLDEAAEAAEAGMVRFYTIPTHGARVTTVPAPRGFEQFDHFLPAMRAAISVAAGFSPEEKRDRSSKLRISEGSPDTPSAYMKALLNFVNHIIADRIKSMFKRIVLVHDHQPQFKFTAMPHISQDEMNTFAHKELEIATMPPTKK